AGYAPTILSRRTETQQKATAIISTDAVSSDNYALIRPAIVIMETVEEDASTRRIACYRGNYCATLSEQVCEAIKGEEIESCATLRKPCLIDEFCSPNMLLADCREIGGQATESCQATPIIQPPPPYGRDLSRPSSPQYGRDSSRPSPLYYNLHGQPLGTAKPTTPGVYIEKHGKHIRKIAVQ
ncbi:MAG: hypothetical protein LBC85_11830, partial [Fibromonadaceae bacterium]|nr:hypothetical protein [Fibromonadaceae bacterium]